MVRMLWIFDDVNCLLDSCGSLQWWEGQCLWWTGQCPSLCAIRSFFSVWVTEQGRDAYSQYALYCTTVEIQWGICQCAGSLQTSEEVEALLSFLCDCINVLGEVMCTPRNEPYTYLNWKDGRHMPHWFFFSPECKNKCLIFPAKFTKLTSHYEGFFI